MTENQRRKFLKLVGAAGIGMALPGVCSGAEEPAAEVPKCTRKELTERLKKLALSEMPKNLSSGAMCYAMIPPRVEMKPCPECERTMQVGEMKEILDEYNVPLKSIQDLGVDAKLVLPEHCPTCGYGLLNCGRSWEERRGETAEQWNARKIHLEIKYPDVADPIRVELDSEFDLQIMAAFLEGKTRYDTGQAGEIALKERLNRLCELFGVTERKPKRSNP